VSADERFDELSALVTGRMDEHVVPGVALGVLSDGDTRTAGFGVTSVEHPLEVTPRTLFQIGSITKTLTATLAMRLVEDGALDLDAPLRRYLPDLRLADEGVAAAVTMRHVLTHTGGWAGDYFDDPGSGDDALALMTQRLDRLEQLTPVGEVWSYNNSGFYLAGRVIEVLAEKPYETVARELLLEPLGMTSSFFFAADVITHRFAVGHITRQRKSSVARPWALARCANAAGGLVSSVEDVLRYARFHLGDGTAGGGTRIVSGESLRAMREPQAEIGGLDRDAVGIAWMIRDRGGKRVVGHDGGTMGQVARLWIVPEEGFAVVVHTNSDEGGHITLDASTAALDAYCGIEHSEPEPVARPAPELQEYLGRYDSQLAEVELEAEDGGLRGTMTLKGGFPTPDTPPPPPFPPGHFAFHGDDRVSGHGEFRGSDGEFLRDDAGEIEWFRFGGRLFRPQRV
jgi:CubicO group peptidase (beta-lactamase class C family)